MLLIVTFVIADSNDSGASPQGRTWVKMKFDVEEGTGDKSQGLDAMLAWIRETKVRIRIRIRVASEFQISHRYKIENKIVSQHASVVILHVAMQPCR